jgi:hypothetical protein
MSSSFSVLSCRPNTLKKPLNRKQRKKIFLPIRFAAHFVIEEVLKVLSGVYVHSGLASPIKSALTVNPGRIRIEN